MRITGSVNISVEATTVEDLRAFLHVCDLTKVPGDTAVQVRATRGHLRRIGVEADPVATASATENQAPDDDADEDWRGAV
ncbi:MAG: hypothetical protein ACRDTZ_00925 [Pseudonocardiaceae bacterium]